LQISANICKYLQIFANICKYLQISANICKYLQISANICKYLQISSQYLALERGERVGDESTNKATDGKVHGDGPVGVLLERGEAHSTDDGEQAQPLGR
jgi:hypothetical protein